MAIKSAWGHININVRDLDASIAFYQKLGFDAFLPTIPYLNLNREQQNAVDAGSALALGISGSPRGRACIMQLDEGFPKLDLTEFSGLDQRDPLENKDLGVVRICLISEDLASDYQSLVDDGVEFLSPPQQCHERLADVATCVDPDGTRIELLQVYLERWGAFL
ncbi:VOC family protein [Congregibacter litoralis]|uniref:Lactoylglutathione lyase n=1 Tax=Congregibacter litoralis KT71 TaxID=314285 RepID=A4A9U1_9GAMM|nr:VOC family protein [Congregibacter litoralis]EAQ97258.1 Lactoylglutathione lyase [Congregibacter litoralis KT71]